MSNLHKEILVRPHISLKILGNFDGNFEIVILYVSRKESFGQEKHVENMLTCVKLNIFLIGNL